MKRSARFFFRFGERRVPSLPKAAIMESPMRSAQFLMLGGLVLPFAEFACGQSTTTDASGGSVSAVGGVGGGAQASGGTRPTRPLEDLGGDLNIKIGGDGGSPATSGGSMNVDPDPGSLAICRLDEGLSAGKASGDLVIDDFDSLENGYSGNGLQGGWFVYDDGSSGSQVPSPDDVAPVPGGPEGSVGALHVYGGAFTEWGSGFATVFASRSSGACLFDASAYSGITFWAKGSIAPDDSVDPWDPGELRVMLVEKDVVPLPDGNCDDSVGDCWSSHRVRIDLGQCWQRYSFRFDEFHTDPWGFPGGDLDRDEFYELAFELGRGNTYDIWIDGLEFFVGEAPAPDSICDMGPGGAGNQ